MQDKFIKNQAKKAENKNKENDNNWLYECAVLYNSCVQSINQNKNKTKKWYEHVPKKSQNQLEEVKKMCPNKQLPDNATVYQAWLKHFQPNQKHHYKKKSKLYVIISSLTGILDNN